MGFDIHPPVTYGQEQYHPASRGQYERAGRNAFNDWRYMKPVQSKTKYQKYTTAGKEYLYF